MLILTAPFALFCTIMPAVMFSSRVGAALGMLMYFPFLFLMWGISSLPKIIKYEGFGLPVWGSALTVLGAYLLGYAAAAVIAYSCYRRGNFRAADAYQVFQK